MTHPDTEFEPAGRASQETLEAQLDKLRSDQLMVAVADGSATFLSILNPTRQIVYANAPLTSEFGVSSDEAVGLRPGELMGCRNATRGPDGCGTSRPCSACGAAKVLRSARLGSGHEEECRILRADGEPLDLRVRATPITVDGEAFILFSAIDISDVKRRRVLERIFFHDIMNTATGVRGLSSMARVMFGEEQDETLELLEVTSDHLVDEIQGQRELLAAESDELMLHLKEAESGRLMQRLAAMYASHEVGAGRSIIIDEGRHDVAFVTDPTLLGRVVGNLVKNALEATPPGGGITLSCRVNGDRIEFSVHNPGVIPERTQFQIFQRSFSTKGRGRGLGTYGARLLAERYLGGTIRFESNAEAGTRFVVDLPILADDQRAIAAVDDPG